MKWPWISRLTHNCLIRLKNAQIKKLEEYRSQAEHLVHELRKEKERYEEDTRKALKRLELSKVNIKKSTYNTQVIVELDTALLIQALKQGNDNQYMTTIISTIL